MEKELSCAYCSFKETDSTYGKSIVSTNDTEKGLKTTLDVYLAKIRGNYFLKINTDMVYETISNAESTAIPINNCLFCGRKL